MSGGRHLGLGVSLWCPHPMLSFLSCFSECLIFQRSLFGLRGLLELQPSLWLKVQHSGLQERGGKAAPASSLSEHSSFLWAIAHDLVTKRITAAMEAETGSIYCMVPLAELNKLGLLLGKGGKKDTGSQLLASSTFNGCLTFCLMGVLECILLM